MYKRIPATSFDTFEDVYFAMVGFMQECGFTVVADSGIDYGESKNVKYTYILQDPNTIHKLCVIYQDEPDFTYPVVHFYVIDDFFVDERLNKQGNIAKYKRGKSSYDEDEDRFYACGILFYFGDGHSESVDAYSARLSSYDLICIYVNKSLMFIYVPINCYVYSHIFSAYTLEGDTNCGSFVFYGNFTKYHIVDIKDCVYLFSSFRGSNFGEALTMNNVYDSFEPSRMYSGILYCHPEGSYDIGDNTWFVGYDYFSDNLGYNPPLLETSFNYKPKAFPDSVEGRLVDYTSLYSNKFNRDKSMMGSTLNNSSVLMPLIVYGLRDPRILDTWSAIGETKLVNMIDMSHISSGDIFIDTGIEKDYHKYFVFPCLTGNLNATLYTFLGLAVEIEAKEDLLHSQSEDYLTINLNDRFRNFDRIEVVYGDNKEIEWRYDDLEAIYDTEGIFNLTKDDNEKCLVYGLKNTDGKSTEYRFTCSESCKIISITGYRE